MDKRITTTAVATAISLMLGACGGGSGSTPADGSGSRTVASGPIEGFGSVIVNGVKFEVGAGQVQIENDDNGDTSTDQSALQMGMVVTVSGSVNDDGVTGHADSIRYDDDLEGPITGPVTEDPVNGIKTFTLLGTTVVVSAADTVFDHDDSYGYADIATGDVVEISGLFGEQGRLRATYMERKHDTYIEGVSQVEIKGSVSNLDSAAQTFTLGSLIVDYSGAVLDDDIGTLSDGLFVEVKGVLENDAQLGKVLRARKVEREGFDDTDDDEKADIEGLISDLDVLSQTFTINGQVVSFAGTVRYEPTSLEGNLADGLKVEVEGPVINGVLQAYEIKIRSEDIEIEAPVHDVDGNSLTLRMIPGDASSNITVIIDANTRFEDGLSSIADVTIGAFVEVKARPDVDDPSLLIATRIQLEDEADEHSLQGPLDSIDSSSVTLLGVTYVIDSSTEFEGLHDESLTLQQFLDMVSAGMLVEVEDENDPQDGKTIDGIADELSLED